MSDHAAEVLRRLLERGDVVVISGAGLSAASGIPAYRDHDGHWQHPPPVQHRDFIEQAPTRQRYWARSFVGWPRMAQARPNGGHRALAALEASGGVSAVITQNVDGLHQRSGSQSVLELHGSIHQVCCLACRTRFSRAEVQDWLHLANPQFDLDAHARAGAAPDGDAHVEEVRYTRFQVPACPACAGLLKPDVVFFGDNVPRERVAAAQETITRARAVLVVGSSLMVYSGYRFVDQAHRLGRPIVAINQGITRADALLTAKVTSDCASVLADLAGVS